MLKILCKWSFNNFILSFFSHKDWLGNKHYYQLARETIDEVFWIFKISKEAKII